MNLTIHFDGCEPEATPQVWSYRFVGWPGTDPPAAAGVIDHQKYGRDSVVAAYAALCEALLFLQRAGGLSPGDTLRLETPEAAVVKQVRGEWGAADFQAKALAKCRELIKDLCQPHGIRPSIHHVPGGKSDATAHPQEPSPGKADPSGATASPPTDGDREAEIIRTLDLMGRGLSSCCEAPIGTSRVIDRPGHRLHGHGPRFCSRCKKQVFVV